MTCGPSAAAAAIEGLMALHPKGFDLSLERITRLLEKLDNPQDRLPPVIHVAGTNGKGSTAAFCRAILEADGKSVHVHTSPHLVNWHERYRIGRKGGGTLVEDAILTEAINRVAEANGGQMITVFEILTAVMFVLFSEHPADAAIIEVGLGGRFDATNVITNPAVSVITAVSLDHQDHLGTTPGKIAFEKAGIIKPQRPVVIAAQPFDEARDVLEETARQRKGAVFMAGQEFSAYAEHGRLVYQDETGLHDLPLPRLPGRHQIDNAAGAICALKAGGFSPSEEAIATGLQSANWPGRLERLPAGHLTAGYDDRAEIWIDGGHNPGAGLVLAEALAEMEERFERPLFLITGMINTKDPRGYFAAFADMARHVITVPVPDSEAGIDPQALALMARESGLSAEAAGSPREALSMILDRWNGLERGPRILIGGSLYLIGSVLRDNGTAPR